MTPKQVLPLFYHKSLNVTEFVAHLNGVETMEKYIATKNNKLAIHDSKWHPDQKRTT